MTPYAPVTKGVTGAYGVMTESIEIPDGEKSAEVWQ